ncbi:MAG: LacI family DNA-binding transcriptional regulator, partial [Coprobacter sp.]
MKPLQKVTIYDLAKELNTSASTVSRALQNHPRISEKMK